ncbi:helix-turn-helix transcriptional regulator [Natronorubrum halophilum]|uniref:helix-turn-helix transcriptional regulator n=1 Tax=Natronorubrum halophilum TaxID=1702106 RepID=UPI0010C22D29|nr:transcriptional regulator [Natronorubrum halophilum]
MDSPQDDRTSDLVFKPPGSPILEAVLQNARNQKYLGKRMDAAGSRIDADQLGNIVRHGPVLEALREKPLDRREIEERLDVSRATSHRLTKWLDEQGFVEKVDSRFQLTGHGEAVTDEVLRFEANVSAVHRMGPLLDMICPHHAEFAIEPMVDATVTVAEPEDPYRPIEQFISLVSESTMFRGFNTTHMAPLIIGEFYQQLFDDTESEVIHPSHIVEKLVDTYPVRAKEAIDRGQLTLRTREKLPYGLAIFDERVGIGGYDTETGLMQAFVDTDSPLAREWAERVYASIKADSTLFDSPESQ